MFPSYTDVIVSIVTVIVGCHRHFLALFLALVFFFSANPAVPVFVAFQIYNVLSRPKSNTHVLFIYSILSTAIIYLLGIFF